MVPAMTCPTFVCPSWTSHWSRRYLKCVCSNTSRQSRDGQSRRRQCRRCQCGQQSWHMDVSQDILNFKFNWLKCLHHLYGVTRTPIAAPGRTTRTSPTARASQSPSSMVGSFPSNEWCMYKKNGAKKSFEHDWNATSAIKNMGWEIMLRKSVNNMFPTRANISWNCQYSKRTYSISKNARSMTRAALEFATFSFCLVIMASTFNNANSIWRADTGLFSVGSFY